MAPRQETGGTGMSLRITHSYIHGYRHNMHITFLHPEVRFHGDEHFLIPGHRVPLCPTKNANQMMEAVQLSGRKSKTSSGFPRSGAAECSTHRPSSLLSCITRLFEPCSNQATP
jgi:hypothetical protein